MQGSKVKKMAKFLKRVVTKPNQGDGKRLIQDSVSLGAPLMKFWVISAFLTFFSDAGVKSLKKTPYLSLYLGRCSRSVRSEFVEVLAQASEKLS
jgi:hypothetical protein